ncbi:serine hydrolase domain-containing protein [Streptomyces sp. RerS4]|uniref:serine hydrolase domain-containing protein n=1 Tax=Streptomyces sp. RerS4 TaxID=2942449 RepID=UPI00201BC4EE|nr:serine hydrolase domain-containing protein [Streptomyces sp. RerS4]UQX01258.1 beta-lactamase family protein [Streptomyces sp. RerS4]
MRPTLPVDRAVNRAVNRPARRLRRTAAASAVAVALLAGLAPAATAAQAPERSVTQAAARHLDRDRLRAGLSAIHEAGIYGVYSSVRDGRERFDGASGVADVDTGRPARADFRHRVGSITKTFTAVAVLQQAEKGRVELDRPVGDYVPDLLPGERGRKVTVRMLLNHTSGIGDYIAGAFPSIEQGKPDSLDEHRFRTIKPTELIRLGVARPQVNEPGAKWSYSNTNYQLLGEILRAVTGEDPERLITRDVIRKAGLRDTYFPGTDPSIRGPHARMYESFFGIIDPPRDYSVYNMTWAGAAGALVSTPQDLNSFYRTLLTGGLLPRHRLDQMRSTVDVKDEKGNVLMRYGLGIYTMDTPCGPVWGHDGGVWGAGTWSLSSPDGARQFTVGHNLMKYQRLDETGTVLLPHPADAALVDYRDLALCGTTAPRTPTPAPGARVLPQVVPALPAPLTAALR